ncbi:MAG: hypothetical protein V2B14_04455 [bacterium]
MKILIKSSFILGGIFGAVLGIISLVPLLGGCIACFAHALIGAGVVFYLKRNSFVGILSLQNGALIGAISGFVSILAASLIYLPISYILSLFLSPINRQGFNFISSFLVMGFSLAIIIMLVFFLALLSALFNAFSGLIIAYIYEKFENNPIKSEGEIIIDYNEQS